MQHFKVSVRYEGLSNRQREVFETALARWTRAIKGWKTPPSGRSAITQLKLKVVITDFDRGSTASGQDNSVARVQPVNLDVLDATAGAQSGLPRQAVIELDRGDLDQFLTHILDYVAIFSHEIGHALGFIRKTLDAMGLVKDEGAKSFFTGKRACNEYRALVAQRDSSNPPVPDGVPIDPSRSHWDETIFGDELMTPHGEGQQNLPPLSTLTLAALDDIGYEVRMDRAELYRLPSAGRT